MRIILTETSVHFLLEVASNRVERGYAGVLPDIFVLVEVVAPADNVLDAAEFLPANLRILFSPSEVGK